jgi:hypothetical protein
MANNSSSDKKKNLRTLVVLILNTILFFTLYKVLLFYGESTDVTIFSFAVMLLYMALLLGFVLGYLIYNRFLYRKGLTPEQLPDTMTLAEKEAFIADGNRRLEKSKWMMTVIFPLVFTFLMDAIDLFILDMFR